MNLDFNYVHSRSLKMDFTILLAKPLQVLRKRQLASLFEACAA